MIYGKKKTVVGRKMGHITILSNNLNKAIDTANKCVGVIEI